MPNSRVCPSCGLGLLLEAREDILPAAGDAFVVVDSVLRTQALSLEAERLLGVDEEDAINRPVQEFVVPADAEARGPTSFAGAIVQAIGGSDDPVRMFVRPRNTFGVRLRARIAPCGPPRAALLVLETAQDLRAVKR